MSSEDVADGRRDQDDAEGRRDQDDAEGRRDQDDAEGRRDQDDAEGRRDRCDGRVHTSIRGDRRKRRSHGRSQERRDSRNLVTDERLHSRFVGVAVGCRHGHGALRTHQTRQDSKEWCAGFILACTITNGRNTQLQ